MKELLLTIQVGLAMLLALLCLWLLWQLGREQRCFWWQYFSASRRAKHNANGRPLAYHELTATHPHDQDRSNDKAAQR